MHFSQDTNSGRYRIKAYGSGQIQVNDDIYTQSLVISANQLITPWPPQTVTEIQESHLTAILSLQPSIVLLGTGTNLILPDTLTMAFFSRHHVGLEIMNTAAACRTYEVLESEGRNVAAALLLSNRVLHGV